MTALEVRSIPRPGPLPPAESPEVVQRMLANGLRVVLARRATVPTVEVRLRVPFAVSPGSDPVRHAAVAELLSASLLSGTGSRSRQAVDEAFADAGAQLRVTVDPQRLLVTGRTLAAGLRQTLATLADCLLDARYPVDAVELDRRRLLERVRMTHAAPRHQVSSALLRQCFAEHPITHQVAELDQLRGVTADEVAALHARRLVPAGSVLTLVGDLRPAEFADSIESVFAGWHGAEPARGLAVPAPRLDAGWSTLRLPTLRQAEVRLAGPSVSREHPDYPAQCLANHVLGGYYLSRLMTSLREERGYIYAGSSNLQQYGNAALTVVEFGSGPQTVKAAVEQTLIELERLSDTALPTETEVANARAQLCGTIAISMSTQAGLAEALAGAYGVGLDELWLAGHLDRLRSVSVGQVQAVAAGYRPEAFTGVILAGPDTEV